MPFVKRHRDYYKYGTELDATVVGSFAKIDEGIASGFSTSQYLRTPTAFNPENNSWEVFCKITTGANITTGNQFLTTNTKQGIAMQVLNSKFNLALSSNGSSWNISSGTSGSYTVLPNTTYWIKLVFDNTSYKFSYSLDGKVYNDDISVISSDAIYNGALVNIGIGREMGEPFLGSIDLSQSYININGTRWWSGDIYTKVGSWIVDGVVGKFSSSNYTRLPFTFEGGSYNNWELVTKIKVNSYSGGPAILCVNSSYGIFNYAIQTSGRVQLALSTSTESWNICDDTGEKVLDLNTWYWYKAEFTGTAYNTYWSIDGKVWNLDSSVQNSTKLGSISALNFGIRTKLNDQILDGSIDMQETYFKANGVDVWHGTKAVIVPSDTITDFGRTVYFKNIVTTKYWKEITTGGRELEYACYIIEVMGSTGYTYAKAPIGSDMVQYWGPDNGFVKPTDSSQVVNSGYKWKSLSEEVAYDTPSSYAYNRSYADDFYKDTTVTTTVEGTPEDYTYTTEEVVPVEVTADEDYDFTEFVPSTQFDYHVDSNKLYQLATVKRSYYKYGTEPNATVVGNFARLDKGVASRFSAGNYITTPELFNPQNYDTWEMSFDVTTSSDVTTPQAIKGDSGNGVGSLLQIEKGLFGFIGDTDNSWQWNIKLETDAIVQPNTKYTVKIVFTGSEYHMYINGTLMVSQSSSSKIKTDSPNTKIGQGTLDARPWLGSIDLSQSYININGERWWSGDEYTKVGSWIDDGVVSGFSTSNYLTVPEILPSEIISSEYVFKITTGASVTSPENQIISAHKSPNTGNIIIRGSKFHLFTGSWNAGVTTVLPNTTYILKTVFDGSNWTLYSSTDDIDWVQEATWTTTNSYAGTNLYVGRDYDTTGEYFTGLIDLTQSYIKINGQEWWHGTKAVLSTEADADYYTDNIINHSPMTSQTKYYKYWEQPVNPSGITATSGWSNVANAFDDSADTYATCGTSTDYIEYDFGEDVFVNGITATGNWASSVSRAMGLRVYSVVNDVEVLLGITNKPTEAATYNLSASFNPVYCSRIRVRLAEENNQGDGPTASYPTRIRNITIQGALKGTSSDYDYYERKTKMY